MKRPQLPLLLIAGLLLCGLAALLLQRGGERGRAASLDANQLPLTESAREAAELADVTNREPSPHARTDELAPRDPERERVPAKVGTLSVRYAVYTEDDDGERIAVGETDVTWTLSDRDEVVHVEGGSQADANGLGEFTIEVPGGLEDFSLALRGEKQGWIQENDCMIDAWDLETLEDDLQDRMELYLDRGTRLEGVVYNPDGTLCEQGRVLATQITDDPDDADVIDDYIEEGQFSLPIYREGLWNLSATADDIGTALAPNILISMERDPAPLEIHLRGAGFLSGVVLGTDEKPMRGVTLHAVLASALEAEGLDLDDAQAFHLSRSKPDPGAFGARYAERLSQHNGEFEIGGLEPGRYALVCLQSAGDRYAASEVVFAQTNGVPIELHIDLCRLTVNVEVSPAPPGVDYDVNSMALNIQCWRSFPRGEGPKGLGSSQFEVHPIAKDSTKAIFLVIPGHVYEVRASPTDPAVSLGSQFFGSFSLPSYSDPEPEQVQEHWIGIEVKQQVAIPRGRGKQQLDLVLPAPEVPGSLLCTAADGASELLITWSLSLFTDAEELATNDQLWQHTVSAHELPFEVSLQPGRYRMRTHSSIVQGSPRLFESSPGLGENSIPHALSGFIIDPRFGLVHDDGVETWLEFEIRSGQTSSVALEHIHGGTLEIALDVHLNGAEEALDLGNEGQDLVHMWKAERLVRDARGEWRHIGLTPIGQPEEASKATTWYRCDNRLAPGAWTIRLELGQFGTVEGDFVIREGATTRLPLRAALE